jgi:endonuclease G
MNLKSLTFLVALVLVCGCTTNRPIPRVTTARPSIISHLASTNTYGGKYSYAGNPVIKDPGTYVNLTNRGFIVGYDDTRHIARWVCFSLHKVAEPWKRITAKDIGSPWTTDNRTQTRVTNADFTNSGYSRGHMAPRAPIDTRYGVEAQRETFFMPNAVPQLQSVNDQGWGDLEDEEDLGYANYYGKVWVICGPILQGATATIGTHSVPVPTGFYRIQIFEIEGRIEVQAFYVKHEEGARAHPISIRQIEQMTGIDFLRDLPNDLESHIEEVQRQYKVALPPKP